MPFDWEGNRRSGVALAMRHRLQWFIYLRAQRLGEGDEHPAYTPLRSMAALYIFITRSILGCIATTSYTNLHLPYRRRQLLY